MITRFRPVLFIFLGMLLGACLHFYQIKSQKNLIEHKAQASSVAEPPAVPPKIRSIKIPILMYHHIGQPPEKADATHRSLTVSVSEFEQQVKWLSDEGYESINLNDIYLYSLGKFTTPPNPVIFTFDDGYLDAFQNAIPILKKYNFTGSFAIITQWPGTTVGDNVYASWDDIKQAYDEKMEIVCHTQNHFDGTNPKFNADYISQNLEGCKKDLSDHNINNNVLIYPYGHYNQDYIIQGKKAGFIIGVTVREGNTANLDNLMQIPRIRVNASQNFEIFKKLILE